MAYFADLTPYRYSDFEGLIKDARKRGQEKLAELFEKEMQCLNVGWLALGEPFETWEAPAEFLDKFFLLLLDLKFLTCGIHSCEFCGGEEHHTAERFGYKSYLGTSEIRVKGLNGETFAVPTLAYHYVERHGYKPPQAFIDAVMDIRISPDAINWKKLEERMTVTKTR